MIARLKSTGAYVDVYKEGSVISKNGVEGCYYRFGDTAKKVIYGSELVFEKDNEGQALLYAVEKTAERTKREMIEKAVEWFEKYLFDIGYPDDWCRDSPNLISGKDRFIKAMLNESK